jgi:hypothetical protein
VLKGTLLRSTFFSRSNGSFISLSFFHKLYASNGSSIYNHEIGNCLEDEKNREREKKIAQKVASKKKEKKSCEAENMKRV